MHCEFGNYLEQALRDRLVCGIRHESTQKWLLSESDLSLTKAIEMARRIQAAETQSTQLKATGSAPVMNVKLTQKRNQTGKQEMCTGCGGKNHHAKDCPHKDVRCYKCHKQSNFAKMCRSKTSIPPRRNFKQTNMVEKTQKSDSDNAILQVYSRPSKPFTVNFCTDAFEVDTGAAVTLISEETYRQNFSNKPLQKASLQLRTYTNSPVQMLGQIRVDVSYGTQNGTYTLYVVKGSGTSLLGRDWMKHNKLDWKSIAEIVNNVTSLCYQPLLDKYADVLKDELVTLKLMKAQL